MKTFEKIRPLLNNYFGYQILRTAKNLKKLSYEFGDCPKSAITSIHFTECKNVSIYISEYRTKFTIYFGRYEDLDLDTFLKMNLTSSLKSREEHLLRWRNYSSKKRNIPQE